jgi:DNA ligase-1
MFIENMRRKYPDNEDVVMVAKGVVTQNLKIGASVKTLNAAYGNDFIPVISCMLGTLYGDVKPASIKWPCVVTEKLDGIRRVLIKQDGICMMYSRSGHYDPYCIEILEEAKHLPDNHVYDGELLAIGDFKNSIELRQATNSIANSKGNKTGLTFNIFDMIPVDEFFKGMSREHALNRKIRLGATLMDESIQLLHEDWARLIAGFGIHQDLKVIKSVPILAFAKNFTEIEPVVEEIWGRGGEGVMLNTATGLYELKRSKQLLKVKHTEEFTLKVIGVTEGFGKFEDTLGALVVDYKGNKVGVGSGFTDAQRKQIWDNPDDYLDRYIEVESFGESKDMLGNVSINCPIFKRFVGENE